MWIRTYILHNLLIFFMVQLLIAVIYIFFKIWDCFNFYKRSCMFKLFNFIEYTLLIVGYVVIIMQIAVFSSLEIRRQQWMHSYFICCFIICVLYWVVFGLFWLWSLFRILGPDHYWIGTNNGNKYIFFFVGMRDSKIARCYDHVFFLAHLVVGFMIGFLLWEPLPQMIVITAVLLVLLIFLIAVRPWRSWLLWVIDIFTQVMIFVPVVIWLIWAIVDHGSCVGCGDREGTTCWVIVMFLWLGLVIGLLLFWLAFMIGYCAKKLPEEVREENYYYRTKDTVYDEVRHDYDYDYAYENVKNNSIMGTNVALGGLTTGQGLKTVSERVNTVVPSQGLTEVVTTEKVITNVGDQGKYVTGGNVINNVVTTERVTGGNYELRNG